MSISHKPSSLGKNQHLVHPRPTTCTNLLELANECGCLVELLSAQDWEQLLVNSPLELRENPLAACLLFLPTNTKEQSHDAGVLPDLGTRQTW